MTYSVEYIGDEDLPIGQDWAVVEEHGRVMLFVKQSAVSAEVLAEAWAGFRKLDRHWTPCRALLASVG